MNYDDKKLWDEVIKIGFKIFLLLMCIFPLYSIIYALGINKVAALDIAKVLAAIGTVMVAFLYPYLFTKAVEKLSIKKIKE